MSDPRVSVVTAVYNGERFISGVVDSILSQTDIDFEYVIVDDGSTDGTPEILRKYARTAQGVVTIVAQPNAGEAVAVNNGINQARGDYVVVVSADDPLLSGHLAKMTKVLDENPSVVVAYPDWEVIDENGVPVRTVTTLDYDIRALVGDFVCIPGPGAMIRRSAIPQSGLRDPSYRFVSDYDAWLKLALIGPFQRVPEILARYRIHPGQATSTGRGQAMADEIERVMRNFFQMDSIPAEVASLRRRAIGFASYYSALQALRSPGIGGKRRMMRSLVLAIPRPVGWVTHRRDPVAVVAILCLPRPHVLFRWWSRWRA